MRFAAPSLSCVCLMLVGCSSHNAPDAAAGAPISPPPPPPAAPPPPPPAAPNGTVRHGNTPIVGARIHLLAANTTGYGKPSVSLLEAAVTGASDSVGAYTVTKSDGSFTIEGAYTCTANTPVYLYAFGGDSGSGNNAASGLLAVLGTCPSSGSFANTTAKITVNEVSTVAAAYAMAGFATDATHVSSSGTPLAQVGIANAFANAASLADLSTGAALIATPVGSGVVPQSELDTLADILAACVGSRNASSCPSLFANATADGTADGVQPTDTATAALNIAHHPGVNVAALYALAGESTAFAPVLTAQPNDFTVALCFTFPNVNTDGAPVGRHPIAIDGEGSVWIINLGPAQSSLFKLAHSGAMLSPAGGFTGGGIGNPQSIAIDESGNAWIAELLYYNGAPGTGAVSEFSSDGMPLSLATAYGSGPTSKLGTTIAIDASGNAWLPYGAVATLGPGAGVAELSSAGSLVTAVANPPGASGISGIAIDAAGNIWGAVPYGATFFNEFSTSGVIVNPPTAGQYSCGAPLIPENEPSGIAVDAAGNIWITSGQGVTKESKSPIPSCSGTGGGIVAPFEGVGGDIAIDGDGHVWVGGGILAELSNAGAPISPATGYQAPGATISAIAPDGSGNLWAIGTNYTVVGLFYSFNAFEFIGASAPVVTPIAAGLKNNTLGSRP